MAITDMQFTKLAMSTRVQREIRDGNLDLSDPNKREQFSQQYSAVNKQVDPLGRRLADAYLAGKVDPKHESITNMQNATVPGPLSHRDLGRRLGNGFEGNADSVLMANHGVAVRKTFREPLSDVKDRFNHMNYHSDLYPRMYGYKGNQTVKVTGTYRDTGERFSKPMQREALFMEHVDGTDLEKLPRNEQKAGFRQIAGKLKQDGFQQSNRGIGPGEAFYHPGTREEINDLHGGNVRMRPNGQAVILDPIQRLRVDPSNTGKLSPINTADSFKNQLGGWSTPMKGPSINSGFRLSDSVVQRSSESIHGLADLFRFGKTPKNITPQPASSQSMIPEGMKPGRMPSPMHGMDQGRGQMSQNSQSMSQRPTQPTQQGRMQQGRMQQGQMQQGQMQQGQLSRAGAAVKNMGGGVMNRLNQMIGGARGLMRR